MAKKQILILTAVVLLIGLGVAGYFLWKKPKAPGIKPEAALEKAGEAAQILTESATKGVLPSINPQSNPLEKAPDVNPASQANPFKGIKTNPFR